MKKKLSILAVLVMVVTLTSHSVLGTYAKYTSTFTASDSARVAKWEINGTNSIDVFAASYNGAGSFTDVVSGDTTDVVAPGTSGSFDYVLSGSPEVNYTLNVSLSGSSDYTGKLVWSLDGTKAGENGTLAELQTAINALYSGKVFAANTSSASTHTIGWTWAIEGTDSEDTNLGNGKKANGGDKDAEDTIKMVVTITATQSEAQSTATQVPTKA